LAPNPVVGARFALLVVSCSIRIVAAALIWFPGKLAKGTHVELV
jgi:hypothetical protein